MSILSDVKLGIGGIAEDYTVFDPTLIIYINGVFQSLYQLRVGPVDRPFSISGNAETWDDFLSDPSCLDADMEMVKSYMILRVRLLFDPPNSSYAIDNMQKIIQEYEWRMNVQVDSETTFDEEETS